MLILTETCPRVLDLDGPQQSLYLGKLSALTGPNGFKGQKYTCPLRSLLGRPYLVESAEVI